MEFTQGATVLSADGKKTGTLERVVLDPQSRDVIAIVLRKAGDLAEDKIVPVDLIQSGQGKTLQLRLEAGALASLEAFEEQHDVVVDEHDLVRELGSESPGAALYWYPPYGGLGAPVPSPVPPRPAYIVRTEENIPPDTVALKTGSRVVDRSGDNVGSVEKVLTDPQANRATHLVISRGLLLKERKLVPTTWIAGVGEETVRLAVGAPQIELLRSYEDE